MVFNKKSSTKGKVEFSSAVAMNVNGSVKPSTSGAVNAQGEDSAEIKVIVRVRPQNDRELQNNGKTIIEVVDNKMLIFDPKEKSTSFFFHNVAQKNRDMLKKQNKQLQFIFDRVFDETSTNNNVFEGTTKNLISSLLDGYNCSVFAYGATGAGKTHTMLGNKEDPGITYRTVAELFSEIERQGKHREFTLCVSYLEIYNEIVQDLLHKSGPLHLREDGKCEVIVAGLKPIAITSAEELLLLLAEGNKNRTQYPTDANKESSRSHAVFQVYIKITNKLDSQVQRVKLSMIDLAGSERASATGCKGIRFKEGANINKSLLALGNCINNLSDGIKYIPYRDSKLTRLLKDSLGGNCYTVMIANIASSSFTYEDTYNTLRYANRAKKIKSTVKKNVSCEMHVSGYIKIVEEQKKEIESLKARLAAYESGALQLTLENKANKLLTEAHSKLGKLYDKKRELIQKMLVLESSDKILACRILYKKDADARLHGLTAADNALSSEEQNASGKTRINKSLHYFQRQRDSLKAQMEPIWQELCSVETEIQKITASQPDVNSTNENSQSKQISEIDKCWISGVLQHLKKLSNLLRCERQSINAITKMMSEVLQNYYNMMKGYGTMTDKMQLEFKELVKMLEGFRNIKWSDWDSAASTEDFSMFTCLSTAAMDPLNNPMPILRAEVDNEENDIFATNILNSTFDVASLLLRDNYTDDNSNENNDESNVPSSKSMQEIPYEEKTTVKGIARKRVLSEKNSEHGATLPKQTNKLPTSNKSIVQDNNRTGKENINKQKSCQMSAKNLAILNKFKNSTGNIARLPPGHNNAEERKDVTLKAMRNKERRGLMTTHPYHKPAVGKKSTAMPSTRVPW
ncbi:hypothetical protein DMN91_010935 [Ooceraea biroi]|uniref:Kinesin motor domain-containing protein n=1 Tax=Ooceraea biroi TaxID=2015173 RepID=A0A3L8D8M2_OOCBI|nr:kinesin-like protein KIF18A [Ooceraea biroi]RLU16867.1 hypothetical protein DMN91_010935 [Ooceraea biroi]